MSSYDVYKSFGRVVNEKEALANFFLFSASWYERPFLRFTIWKERVKRYLSADIRLKGDNPFGCMFWFFTILFIVLLVFGLMVLGKILL